ncbi:MAG: rhodanese-like domain-containing protein [Planctomycetota bacterium]
MSVATAVRRVVCLAVLFAAGHAAAKPPAGAVTPQGHTADSLDVVRANLVAGRALLLDVREPSEWNAGHLAIAKPLPLSILRAKDGDATFARFLRNNISY